MGTQRGLYDTNLAGASGVYPGPRPVYILWVLWFPGFIFIDVVGRIHSWFSRISTARGSCHDLVTVGPTKACKSGEVERATPSGEAHHRVNGPNTGRNSGGWWIKKMKSVCSTQPAHRLAHTF